MKQHISIALIVAAVFFGIIAAAYLRGTAGPMATSRTDQGPSPSPVVTEAPKQLYRNTLHLFSVEYDSLYAIREYSADNATIGVQSGEAINGVVDISVVTVGTEQGESAQDALVSHLMNQCAADGPDASLSCTGVESADPYQSRLGIEGLRYVLQGEQLQHSTQEVTLFRKGPFYVFPLESSETISTSVVIHAPLNVSMDEAQIDTIQDIAYSLQRIQLSEQEARVRAYIEENISLLSPEKEQLGGTFYVTSLQVGDGMGTVSYEDGHNAYIADFTYIVEGEGNISVPMFTLRAGE